MWKQNKTKTKNKQYIWKTWNLQQFWTNCFKVSHENTKIWLTPWIRSHFDLFQREIDHATCKLLKTALWINYKSCNFKLIQTNLFWMKFSNQFHKLFQDEHLSCMPLLIRYCNHYKLLAFYAILRIAKVGQFKRHSQ